MRLHTDMRNNYFYLHDHLKPQVVHRTEKKILHLVLYSAIGFTSSSIKLISSISRTIVRRLVSLGLPTVLFPPGPPAKSLFRKSMPRHSKDKTILFARTLFFFPITLGSPALTSSSSSLTLSNHWNFRIFLRHLPSNLRTLSSTSFRPFQDSQPYRRTDITMLLKSLIFVITYIPLSFHTLFMHLKAQLALFILTLTSHLFTNNKLKMVKQPRSCVSPGRL